MTEAMSLPWADLDAAIEDGADTAFAFLERLVAAPSTVGAERGAQDVVAAELSRLGFEVTELDVSQQAAATAPGGVAQGCYAGRPNVLGRINPGGSPSAGDWASSVPGAAIAGFFAAGGLPGRRSPEVGVTT